MAAGADLRRPHERRAAEKRFTTGSVRALKEEFFDEPATPGSPSTIPSEEPVPAVRANDAAMCEPPDEAGTLSSDLN